MYRRWVAARAAVLTTPLRPYSNLFYVIEPTTWAISEDGRHLTGWLRRDWNVPARLVRSSVGIQRQVVHFGSRNLYMLGGDRDVAASNRKVMTWYHGHPDDPNLENQAMIAAVADKSCTLDRLVTSATITRARLIEWGVPEAKVALVPIGVDLTVFRPVTPALRAASRRALGIGDAQICVGLFHKDGEGWGEGLTPKWVKAPEVFLDVVEQLAARYPIFVLLTGPARGFVIEGLKRLGVPHAHRFLDGPAEVAAYYHALDLYLVPSREEGGPKALLECFASGVPIVSTRVGMSADVIRHGENGLLTEVGDAEGLACAAASLIDSPALRQSVAANALSTVQPFAWQQVAARLYETVYRPLLTGVM